MEKNKGKVTQVTTDEDIVIAVIEFKRSKKGPRINVGPAELIQEV